MNRKRALSVAFVGLVLSWPLHTKGDAQSQEKPTVQIPQPGVPQIMTMEGRFVRAAYNNEGYVILGYQASNRSVGTEWMMLEVGMTVLERTPDYRLTREALSLETPDGKTLPLAPISEQRAATEPVQQIQQQPRQPDLSLDGHHVGDGGESVLRDALSKASKEVIEKIAWEVVPQLAETIIRAELERLIKDREAKGLA